MNKKRKTYQSKVGFTVDSEFGKRTKLIQEIIDGNNWKEIFDSFDGDIEWAEEILKDPENFSNEKEREEYKTDLQKFKKEINALRSALFNLNEKFRSEFMEPLGLEIKLQEAIKS